MNDNDIEPQVLFTYGTFRPEDEDSPRNLDPERVIGEGQVDGAVMFHLGGFPGVVPIENLDGDVHPEVEGAVVGDVLDYRDLDEDEWRETLNRFDMIEGHPSMFKRERIRVEVGDTEYLAWVYFYNREPRNASIITGGDWLEQSPRQNRF